MLYKIYFKIYKNIKLKNKKVRPNFAALQYNILHDKKTFFKTQMKFFWGFRLIL